MRRSQLQRGITLLTLAATVLHTWAGCCNHHAHADANAVTARSLADPVAPSQESACHTARRSMHQHGDAIPAGTDERGRHPYNDCDEEACKYVAAPVAKLVHVSQESPALLTADDSGSNAALHRLMSRRTSNLSPAFCSSALRVHQATQVWRV